MYLLSSKIKIISETFGENGRKYADRGSLDIKCINV